MPGLSGHPSVKIHLIKLKEGLTALPMLGYPDRNKGYRLYTDASVTSIGAVLYQECEPEYIIVPGIPNERPIHFLSHKLSPTMQKMSVIERETFALKFALDKFQIYVQESHVTCFVNHQPLKYLLTANLTNKKLQSYAIAISGYNVTIEYISGKKNRVADMLTRCRHDDSDEPVHENTILNMYVGKQAYKVVPPEHEFKGREVNEVNLNRIRPDKDAYNPIIAPEIAGMPEYFDANIDINAEQLTDEKCICKYDCKTH